MRVLKALTVSWLVLATSSTMAIAEDCLAKKPGVSFLPITSVPKNLMPLTPPGADVPPDCDFYQWAWQTFLFVTQAEKDGVRAFLKYPTFEKVFQRKLSPLFADDKAELLSLAPRNVQYPNRGAPPGTDLSDFAQARVHEILIDQSGNAVWYAIHLNNEFVNFLHDYNLTDPNVLRQIPPNLEFRPGVLELKSAWQVVEGKSTPKNYITRRAVIPVFKTDADGTIIKDGNKTRNVTVALLSLHVVGVIEGHPEFIWATFEHVSHPKDGPWVRDVAPAAHGNPDALPLMVDTKAPKYALYPVDPHLSSKPPEANANKGSVLGQLKLDAKTQKFSPITPIYRVFPGSNSKEADEDDGVSSLNKSIQKLFSDLKIINKDVRSNYQLVGAVWLNTPQDDFKVGANFSDIPAPNPPRKISLFGGENRMSNVALESFTQPANSFPNCFNCHDTDRAGDGGVKLSASMLNVSHVLSKFYDMINK